MSPQRILQQGEIEDARGGIEESRLPLADLFLSREKRCEQLSQDGQLFSEYLDFVQRLCTVQHRELALFQLAIPDVLPNASFPLDGKVALAKLPVLDRAVAVAMISQSPEVESILSLAELQDEWILTQARALLSGDLEKVEAKTAPLLGAALQLAWTGIVKAQACLPQAREEESPVCPLCGGQPVAAVIEAAGANQGLRYLHCSLCGASWHMVRAKCTSCDNSKDIQYFSLQELYPHVAAEACPTCRSYLKVMFKEKEPELEPTIDDLASMALDIRMGEAGYSKSSTNFLFYPG